jgi:hypothetical protein
LVAHVAGGGRVSLLPALGVLVCLAGLGWMVTGKERSGPGIAVLVVTTQLAAHLAFAAQPLVPLLLDRGTGRRAPSTAELAALLFCHHGTHAISATQVHQAAQGLNLSAATVASTTTPGIALWSVVVAAVPMLAAHLGAAGVLAWWLRCGERACWAAARAVLVTLRAGSEISSDLLARISVRVVGPQTAHLAQPRIGAPAARRGPPPLLGAVYSY